MLTFRVVLITTGRQVGTIQAKSLHAAKCKLGRGVTGIPYNQFNRVYPV